MQYKLLIIFLLFVGTTIFASEDLCEITEEDKQWLDETYAEKHFWREWIYLNPDPFKVFNRLEEKCMLESQDKIRSLKIAKKWLANAQHCKTVFSWQSFNYSDVEDLVNNENIVFAHQSEKDLFFLTLCDFVYTTENRKKIDCLFLPSLSLENHNKLLYYFRPVFNMSNFWTIQNCIKKIIHNGLFITEEESIKIFFNPIMYTVFDDKVRRYAYKDVIGVCNVPVMITCLHILKKNRQLMIPKVLVSLITHYIIGGSVNDWAKVKEEGDIFMHYCDYIERTIPFLMEQDIKTYHSKLEYFTEQSLSNPEQFRQLYAELKK